MTDTELLDLIEYKFYNVVRIGTYFAVSNKRVPTCENDADGYSLSLRWAIYQAEKAVMNDYQELNVQKSNRLEKLKNIGVRKTHRRA